MPVWRDEIRRRLANARMSPMREAEVIEDAWLTRASKRRAARWLAEHPND
jgi:hypothetical protein